MSLLIAYSLEPIEWLHVMLGGDGRNNQILLALWKAKSIREHDIDNEVIFYVIEEPESTFTPHQQENWPIIYQLNFRVKRSFHPIPPK